MPPRFTLGRFGEDRQYPTERASFSENGDSSTSDTGERGLGFKLGNKAGSFEYVWACASSFPSFPRSARPATIIWK